MSPVEGADVLIMESTYGNRTHPPYRKRSRSWQRIVNETLNRGGSLLIPAFAVGRTQQLVYSLHKLISSGAIPEPADLCGQPPGHPHHRHLPPASRGLRRRDPCLSADNDDKQPLRFRKLQYTQSVEESKALNERKGPAIIISASGMMEGGRILHHLQNRIDDPRNTILITGWQAPNTLGRRIVEKEPLVRIYGDEFQVRANVEVQTGLSGHADHDGLMDFVRVMDKKPEQTFIVHGEDEASQTLAHDLRAELGLENVVIPEPLQSFVV